MSAIPMPTRTPSTAAMRTSRRTFGDEAEPGAVAGWMRTPPLGDCAVSASTWMSWVRSASCWPATVPS